ncbi:MAG: carbonic anhydrase [Phycisphaeraceae bacterium]
MNYESRITYESSRIHAAAIYCSDGRVGEHFDDFLQNGLGLPRYDRVALPGGPSSLAGHTEAHVQEKGVIDELNFLVKVHKLQRVVLIAHQGCAFYSTRLDLPAAFVEHQQMVDLIKASRFIQRITTIKKVDAYMLRLHEGKVVFEEVKLT